MEAENVFLPHLQKSEPSPVHMDEALLAKVSFGLSAMENTGRKLLSCFTAYASKRYLESYVKRLLVFEMAPARHTENGIKKLNWKENLKSLCARI